MEGTGDFPDGPSKPVYGDDHEVIAFTEPAHALRPAGSVATSATGRGVGEDPVGGDPSRRDGVVLLIDGLLPMAAESVGAHDMSTMTAASTPKRSPPRPARTSGFGR